MYLIHWPKSDRNMSFLMKSIALGKDKYGLPEKEVWNPTHFIRNDLK